MSSQVASFPNCSVKCPKVAELEGKVEEFKEENQELKEKLALKDEKIKRLWRKLRRYHNPHTPPSKRLGSTKSKSGSSKSRDKQEKLGSGKPGRKKGHKGVTRPQSEPGETIVVEEKNCSRCGLELGESDKTETRVIEDIAEPQPIEVTEYKVNHYKCDSCGEEVVASHDNLPPEGRFGYDTVAQTTLYKYHGRSVHRKTRDLLDKVYKYASIVESVKKDGKSTHRVVQNIGRIESEEDLERAKKIEEAYKKGEKVVKLGDLSIPQTREYGLLWAADELWKKNII